ncbi:MAG: hypothetical protein OHK0046_08210 [Anaerolineae bacterium]
MSNRVFVSYSRRNKTFAERISRDLSDAGLDVWVDWRQIHAGEFWQDEIFRGLARSDIIVALISPPAVMSEWVQREINTGREQGKVIIPVMVQDAFATLSQTENLRWLLDVQFINFENRYEEAFQELLDALPGKRKVGTFDVFDEARISNPFKGLEAFQQTDSDFFFGRETLIDKALDRIRQNARTHFLGVVGASGSGKSSLVRAGVIPRLRSGAIPGSDQWRVLIFTPGDLPVDALAQRLAPLIDSMSTEDVSSRLHADADNIMRVAASAMQGTPSDARLLLVIDQFEEVFTRAGEAEREQFLEIVQAIATAPGGHTFVLVTMRADFFDRLSRYPELARLFEQENLLIVAEMTPEELLRAIEGPAQAVGLQYDPGLAQRILEDVRRQPGSLPLLQYALKELFERRRGSRLTMQAYEAIGGVQGALAQRAEQIYTGLNPAQQAIMRRVLLRLIEVSDTGEATRRRIARQDLNFRDVPDEAVQQIIDLLTSADARLLTASREIKSSSDERPPTTWIEVGHEALIREWVRFKSWVAENQESLRISSEIMQSATDWQQAGRDVAYLLTGNRLFRAEGWLDTADPTALQREFVQASITENDRREAARQAQIERELALQRQNATRLRLFVGVLVISLIVAIGLSLVTFDSLNEANAAQTEAAVALQAQETARNEAEQNAQRALSLALAASANRAFGDDDDDLALLLAVEANEYPDSPPQAQRILAEVAYAPGPRFLLQHSGPVNAADFGNAMQMVTAAETRLTFWNVETGEEITTIDTPHSDDIRALAFSPDGTRFATAGDDQSVLVWDAESRSVLLTLAGHERGVLSLAFSPDGTQLVSGGGAGESVAIVWDVATGAERLRLRGHIGQINSVAYSAGGDFIITGSADDTARVWSTANGSLRTTLQHPADVVSVAFDPTSANRIATGTGGSEDNNVRLWSVNLAAGDVANTLFTLTEHGDRVSQLVFSPDGAFLLSGSDDRSIIQWNTETGGVIDTFTGHGGAITSLQLQDDLILSSALDTTARIWTLARAEQIAVYEGHQRVSGGTVAAVYGPGDEMILSGGFDETLRLWNTNNGLTVQEFRGHEERVLDIAMSSDGATALSGSQDRTVILWDILTAQPIHRMTGHASAIQSVVYLPDGNRAVSSDSDGVIIEWDLTTGTEIRRYAQAAKAAAVFDLAVRPDGDWLLGALSDFSVVVWSTETGTVLHTLTGHDTQVRAVTFDATGDWALSGAFDGDILLWNMREGSADFTSAQLFTGHDRGVFGLDFAPDSTSFASGSLDGTIRLWDIESGLEIRRYQTDRDSTARVRSVDFRGDGEVLLTGMTDATVREWRVLLELNDLLAWAFENRLVTEPSCETRRIFSIDPLCDAQGNIPTSTPFPLPSATPTSTIGAITLGVEAVVNTLPDTRGNPEPLNLRRAPGLDAAVILPMPDGTRITVIGGPEPADGFMWWNIRTADGYEGWAVESEAGVQTLVPVKFLE